jgi:hypothetical protein
MYNEMPWTPFFLRHLLDFDCPIFIGEGASESKQNNNDRSTDGSWELIRLFMTRWSDRVKVYLHDYTLNTQTGGRKNFLIPRENIKMKVWNEAADDEWIIGLSPDNIYRHSDVKKIKDACDDAAKDDYMLMTGQRVFAFNFQSVTPNATYGLCGGWTNLWPCIWRKNNEYVQFLGDELLKHCGTMTHLATPDVQDLPRGESCPHVIFRKDIKQFHYKNVKKHTNRVQRFGSELGAQIFDKFDLTDPALIKYTGSHPSVLDNHPWRYTLDCRKEKPNFDWRDFTDLVMNP